MANGLQRIAELRQKGLSPVSVNTYVRHVKAFYRWQNKPFKLPVLKEEQKVLATLTPAHIHSLLNFKPKGQNLRRAHIVALCMLDCGLRVNETISLLEQDVDFYNLVLRVKGKGGKERLVPFSAELRKILFRYVDSSVLAQRNYVFSTKNHTKVSTRNLQRDFAKLGQACNIGGIRFSPHVLRHTFAVQFLSNGGDIYILSRILGHSSVKVTEVYLKSLNIEALKKAHRSFSPLAVR